MKKIIKSFLVVLMGFLMSVNVMADVQQEKQNPDYTTDYYMIVESKAGGIDIYSLPDLSSSKLNDSQIPNGTALHIEGETEDKENNRTWGYTEYHGMHGYVPLDDCKPAQSRKEAIDSELYIAGSDNVDYNADYDVKAYSEDGSQKLYQVRESNTVKFQEFVISRMERLFISQRMQNLSMEVTGVLQRSTTRKAG